jgi:non-specific serine/threonine protein kinase/serine/threonine-protein kinase
VTPEQWERVKQLFEAALEREPSGRDGFLAEACRDDEVQSEVRSLLESHEEAGSFIKSPTRAEVVDAPAEVAWVGRRIGAYQIVGELGSGGMGAVYLAVRADDQYRKQVAIKLIRGGMDTERVRRRFREERQILASLEHPNIARLLDGGTTEDGVPYVVMELIEGEPIDRYADTRGLDTSKRLRLFQSVCAAVHYAHQNLVIHRDIKPSNILVTGEGIPKLLDFGIAKLVQASPGGGDSVTGLHLMTPDYASPEQIRGEAVTTATDVYSLGVLLYELLTGHRPYRPKGTLGHELAAAICEQEPEKPSAAIGRTDRLPRTDGPERQVTPESVSLTREGGPRQLRRRLAGDLDNIVLLALRKQPRERYASAEQLSEDIRRHLEGQAVRAHPPTLAYRAGKFVRRNRIAVAAAGLLLATLVAGISATTWQARVARRERARAERRFGDVRRLANSFLFDFHDAIATLPGSTPARELVVKKALEYLDSLAQEAASDPSLQLELAAAYEKVGDVQGDPSSANLGQTAGALESYRKALGLREVLAAAGAKDWKLQNDLATSHGQVGTLLGVTGDAEKAMFHWQQALTIRQALAATDPANPKAKRALAISYHELGEALVDRGDLPGALGFYRQELALFQELAAADPTHPTALRNLALARKKVGGTLVRMGQLATALEHYQEALALDESRSSAQPEDAQARIDVSFDHSDIGLILSRTGDTIGAIDRYRKVVAIREELSQSDPRNAHARGALASAYIRLARPLAVAGRLAEALDACRKGVAIRQALVAADPAPGARRELADAEWRLGDILKQSGDPQAASESYRLAVSLDEALAVSDPGDADVRRELAILHARLGALYEALALLPRQSRVSRLECWSQARSWYEKGRSVLRDLPDRGAPGMGSEKADPDELARGVARCEAALARLGRPRQSGAAKG